MVLHRYNREEFSGSISLKSCTNPTQELALYPVKMTIEIILKKVLYRSEDEFGGLILPKKGVKFKLSCCCNVEKVPYS